MVRVDRKLSNKNNTNRKPIDRRAIQTIETFLENHGKRFSAYEQIKEVGDILGFPDFRNSGFYAFITNGFHVHTYAPNISLYKQNLDFSHRDKGNIKSMVFGIPEKYFYAQISNTNELKPGTELWFTQRNFLGHFLDEVSIENGIYRITSEEIIKLIRKTFDNFKKEHIPERKEIEDPKKTYLNHSTKFLRQYRR